MAKATLEKKKCLKAIKQFYRNSLEFCAKGETRGLPHLLEASHILRCDVAMTTTTW